MSIGLIPENLADTEIHQVDLAALLVLPEQDILGLQVAMDHATIVGSLQHLYKLKTDLEHRFQGKLFEALQVVGQILAQQLDYHDVVVLFLAEPVELWNALGALESLENGHLPLEGFDLLVFFLFDFDCHILLANLVVTQEHHTKTTRRNLLHHQVPSIEDLL